MMHLYRSLLVVAGLLAAAATAAAQSLPSLPFLQELAASDGRGLQRGGGRRCSAHPACIDEGYDGDGERCCPTRFGCYRSCCDADELPEEPGTCSSNSQCADDGLVGECCPTGTLSCRAVDAVYACAIC